MGRPGSIGSLSLINMYNKPYNQNAERKESFDPRSDQAIALHVVREEVGSYNILNLIIS